MANEQLSALDQIDLEKLTLEDISNLKNTVLRDVLKRALARELITPDSPVHSSHGAHTSHVAEPAV